MTRRLRRTTRIAAWLLLAGLTLAGCGQMGPLTLPEPGTTVTNGDQDDEQDEDQADDER